MITEAVVIGAVEAAVFWDDDELGAVRLRSGNGELLDCTRDVGMLLSIGMERRRLPRPPKGMAELGAELRAWSERHRALTMVVSGMDAQLTEQTRTSCILAAESCLERGANAAFVRARVLGCPLPGEADLETALRLAFEAEARRVAALYGELTKARDDRRTVRRVLEEPLLYDFEVSTSTKLVGRPSIPGSLRMPWRQSSAVTGQLSMGCCSRISGMARSRRHSLGLGIS
jgi:hypothetical protein